jgi:hypothetical protein
LTMYRGLGSPAQTRRTLAAKSLPRSVGSIVVASIP